ncbi:hypothetical protein P8C59_004473 [Phyllachora maydis]|uniref:Protein transport protein BOS1 n=1 Tax=Phyllachora maydis TaxID=1825666 RepID=A0AAD9MBB7_9PEZI|nr:hypothetical protein P8C59_004473 [Phyllachora maydis]
MNTAFNSALKQSTSLRKDLAALSRPDFSSAPASDPSSSSSYPSPPPPHALTPAALGSLSASLTAFTRTLDEYATFAKQELNPAKADKAQERLRNFRQDLAEFRAQFDALKAARDDLQSAHNRSELLGRRPYTGTPENPYANAAGSGATTASRYGVSSSSGLGHARNASAEASSGGMTSMGSGDVARETHALREQSFFSSTNVALDEYIARGQAVLSDLGQQREILKNTQKKLYTVGNTLGISGDTIRMIERRAKQDKWIFWAGVIVFFLFCWLVLHYLR